MHASLVLLLLAQISNLPALNGTVTGVLRTASGKPAAGVRVTAVVPPASGDEDFKPTTMASIAETDSEGRYRLEGIPPGRYYIGAGRVDLQTYYPGSTILSEGTLVAVIQGATVARVDFVLRDQSAGRSAGPLMSLLSSLYPPGFNIPVTIRVDGAGKVPVFQSGSYPVIRATNASSKDVVEILFSGTTLTLPLPSGSRDEEYNITAKDLQGYTVKSITYGSADLQNDTLKVQRQGLNIQQSPSGIQPGPFAVSSAPITVILTDVPASPRASGVRVTGHSVGAGDEIYISGIPGILYSDGTFEFREVPPGLHNIVMTIGNSVTVAPVIIGDRDVDNIALKRPQLLPIDVFAQASNAQNGSVPESRALSMVSIVGRVLDDTSQEELYQGAVTLSGYGNTRRTFAITGGGFQIPDLLPGAYNLTINIYGYSSATQSVTLGVEDIKLDLIARKETQ